MIPIYKTAHNYKEYKKQLYDLCSNRNIFDYRKDIIIMLSILPSWGRKSDHKTIMNNR